MYVDELTNHKRLTDAIVFVRNVLLVIFCRVCSCSTNRNTLINKQKCEKISDSLALKFALSFVFTFDCVSEFEFLGETQDTTMPTSGIEWKSSNSVIYLDVAHPTSI